MSKKYLQLDGEKVTLIHNMPFDSVHGFHKSEAELLKTGILVDEVPEPEIMEGKIALPMYNVIKGFYYAYEEKPLTDEEKKLKSMQETIDMLLIDGLKA